ncbi:MAG: stage V sporulation protein AC [Halanaerobiaceae bacterium]
MKNINKTADEYKNLIEEKQFKKNKLSNILKAFFVGGLICLLGQWFWNFYINVFNYPQDQAGALGTITMIFLGGLLTGLGVYDELGQFAGAGSIVPVTGFANAMVSPALEYKQEGLIMGLGANLFSVAGPVLTYGMVSAFIIGVLKKILGG